MSRRSHVLPTLAALLLSVATLVLPLADGASARSAPITLTVSPASASVGTTVRASGKVARARRGTRVVVQEQAGKSWTLVARTKTGKRGTFAVTVLARTAGGHSYRAVAKIGGRKVTSRPATLTVTTPAPTTAAKPAPPTPIDQLTLASASTAGTGGNGDSSGSSISADGRYIAFTSAATNLVPGDANGHLDVFLRDTVAGTTTLISHTPSGGFANADSYSPSISGNGRFIAFTSYATDLVGSTMLAGENAYLWDRTTGFLQPVCRTCGNTNSASVASNGDAAYIEDYTHDVVGYRKFEQTYGTEVTEVPSANDEMRPRISDDASTIVFDYVGSALTGTISGGRQNVYLVRTASPSTTLMQLSLPSEPGPPSGDSGEPSVSSDGRYVAFTTNAGNIAAGLPAPQTSNQIVVTDTTNWSTALVSRTPGGFAADGNSRAPVISGDGSTIAYQTTSTTLVPGLSKPYSNVVEQPCTGAPARLVSHTFAGVLGNDNSVAPSISGDGRYVAFHSKATNLVAADTDPAYDIYRWDALGNR